MSDSASAWVEPFTIYLTICPHCGFQENYGHTLPLDESISICGSCERQYIIMVVHSVESRKSTADRRREGIEP